MKFRSYLESENLQPSSVGLVDDFQRAFRYVRLSITDRCNFRCQYCLPHGYQKPAQQVAELSLTEIRRLVRGFASLGVTKLRLTGGEPSLRRDLVDIIADISTNTAIQHIAVSSNGIRLERDVTLWAEAGLTSVNVSVDSLDAPTFAKFTGSDSLPIVLRGIDQALAIPGLQVKMNAVLHQHTAAADVLRFFDFVKNRAVTVRFIELMETAGTQSYFESGFVSTQRVVQYLQSQHWSEVVRSADAGPAREFAHPDYVGRIGVIAPYSRGFCDSCNRLRVSASGELHTCLFNSSSQSLRHYLQTDHQLPQLQQQLLRAVASKAASHNLHRRDTGLNKGFSAIGG